MKILPKSEMTIEPDSTDPNYVILGAYEHEGYRYFTKVPLRSLPNNLVSRDDLERFGIGLPSPIEEVKMDIAAADYALNQVSVAQRMIGRQVVELREEIAEAHRRLDLQRMLSNRVEQIEQQVEFLTVANAECKEAGE